MEIAVDLLQARFGLASGWPTIHPEPRISLPRNYVSKPRAKDHVHVGSAFPLVSGPANGVTTNPTT